MVGKTIYEKINSIRKFDKRILKEGLEKNLQN